MTPSKTSAKPGSSGAHRKELVYLRCQTDSKKPIWDAAPAKVKVFVQTELNTR